MMPKKSAPPSISETAFDCPHCGAYTTQYWFEVFANSRDKNNTPHIPNEETRKRITEDTQIPDEAKQNLLEWCEKMDSGLAYLEKNDGKYVYNNVHNLNLSKCYNCNKVAVWVHGNLIFPNQKLGVLPNPDLPDHIIRDYEEARGIIGESPRGAAALLRLSVQKLCLYLGEKGKNIDDDIASLVAKGLNPLVQKSLDIVRVVGNEAVHPGTIDLNDDRDTATQLLVLINSIADQMISHPKKVEELYGNLPEKKREAIEKRNNKAKPSEG
ncbi:MAG: DUF4145 domain-containing protein [Candidatus Sedimenticola sp. (ex Thyasira tokunagai)]